jgi:hypothetical protein
MEKPDLNEQPVAGTPSDSPLGCPILDFKELIKFRSDRSGSQAFSILLYDMPECGAVDTETEESYGFAYRPRIEKGGSGANFLKCMFLSGEKALQILSGQDHGPNFRSGGWLSG